MKEEKNIPIDLLKYSLEKQIKSLYDVYHIGNTATKKLHLELFEEKYSKELFDKIDKKELKEYTIKFLEDIQALVLQMSSGYRM